MATAPEAPRPRTLRETLAGGAAQLSSRGSTATTAAALVGALVVTGVVIAVLGASPIAAVRAIVSGSLGSTYNFGQTLSVTAPLALTGLAAAIPFSARLWNAGGEGQLYAGAIAGVLIALTAPPLPHVALAALALVGGMVAGSLWASIAGILKAAFGANEIITTLMLNFIALLVADYVITGPWAAPAASTTKNIPANATLPIIWSGTTVGTGALIALAAVVAANVLMKNTTLGFGIRAVGAGGDAAKLAGFRIPTLTVSAFAAGGAFAGIAGAIAVLGVQYALVANISENYGFTGIAVALIARLNPLLIIPSAFFFAITSVGGNNLTATTGISPSASLIITAAFVIFLLAFGVIKLSYPERSA